MPKRKQNCGNWIGVGLLNCQTVLIHALAIGQRGWNWCAHAGHLSSGARVRICFLFGRTLDREFIDACPSFALGSDSPLTSAGDLLDEIRTAQTAGVSPAKIYDLVTRAGAKFLGCLKVRAQFAPERRRTW